MRVLFAHWVEPRERRRRAAQRGARRARSTAAAAFYLRALEPFIAAFQGLVGRRAVGGRGAPRRAALARRHARR